MGVLKTKTPKTPKTLKLKPRPRVLGIFVFKTLHKKYYTNLLKWNTSCHQLDHVSGFDDNVRIPSFSRSAYSHTPLNNIKLTFQSLKKSKMVAIKRATVSVTLNANVKCPTNHLQVTACANIRVLLAFFPPAAKSLSGTFLYTSETKLRMNSQTAFHVGYLQRKTIQLSTDPSHPDPKLTKQNNNNFFLDLFRLGQSLHFRW